jgi:hypothetical protein
LTLIIGADGSMGKRYQAILRHLGKEVLCADIEHKAKEILSMVELCDRVIIATPTETHRYYLKKLIPMKIPVLCEKPVVKKTNEIAVILNEVEKFGTPFTMMNQYYEISKSLLDRPSSYDYFRTGKDGLIWDCLQIIGLAQGEVTLENKSPIWKCTINGETLNFADMDRAYVSFVEKWVNDRVIQSPEYIFKIHQKTEKMHNEYIQRYM